jgi:hypothetical protein
MTISHVKTGAMSTFLKSWIYNVLQKVWVYYFKNTDYNYSLLHAVTFRKSPTNNLSDFITLYTSIVFFFQAELQKKWNRALLFTFNGAEIRTLHAVANNMHCTVSGKYAC